MEQQLRLISATHELAMRAAMLSASAGLRHCVLISEMTVGRLTAASRKWDHDLLLEIIRDEPKFLDRDSRDGPKHFN
jgi:hypothetical protein